MVTVYLGVGSNLGDRALNIKNAITRLNENKITVKKVSTMIETDPVGGPKQGKFLNGALEAQTDLSPEILRNTLKAIEKELGRENTVRNGPRTIDLDILLYGDETIHTAELTIPHLRMFERDFVMIPLKEIAPEIVKKFKNRPKSNPESNDARHS